MAENSGGTAKRRGAGNPFPAGMSGNPGGRPKVIAEVRDLARQHTRKAIQTLVTVMQSGESDNARVAAANALLDRGYGKPRTDQPVTLDEMDGALADQGRAVLRAMALGKLTPSEAATIYSGSCEARLFFHRSPGPQDGRASRMSLSQGAPIEASRAEPQSSHKGGQ